MDLAFFSRNIRLGITFECSTDRCSHVSARTNVLFSSFIGSFLKKASDHNFYFVSGMHAEGKICCWQLGIMSNYSERYGVYQNRVFVIESIGVFFVGFFVSKNDNVAYTKQIYSAIL